ncbi:MAG: alpha-ketoglutarate-dependent dioxygenase AlkB [Anaerolineae bacterium]|nr:alpha-ketoglutarate-dependent dioxygenase AlkB [Anaerolineae bacterium]
MPDAEVYLVTGFFSPAESGALLTDLTANIAWEQKAINIMGKQVMQPRLIAWYGDVGKSYRYSGLTVHPLPWTPTLLDMKARVEAAANVTFNSVLLNLYRDGQDSVGWHSDDEPELGTNPVIASISLGAARTFQFKHKQNADLKQSVELTHGSLLLMRGTTQHYWKHQIPKTKKPLSARINLTFRVIQ